MKIFPYFRSESPLRSVILLLFALPFLAFYLNDPLKYIALSCSLSKTLFLLLQVILVFSPRHSTAFRHFEESNFMEYLNECFYFCADVVAWYGNKSYVIYSLNYHSSNNSKHFFQGFYPKKPVTIEFLAWKILKVYIVKKFRTHGSYSHQSQHGHCLIIAMIR